MGVWMFRLLSKSITVYYPWGWRFNRKFFNRRKKFILFESKSTTVFIDNECE